MTTVELPQLHERPGYFGRKYWTVTLPDGTESENFQDWKVHFGLPKKGRKPKKKDIKEIRGITREALALDRTGLLMHAMLRSVAPDTMYDEPERYLLRYSLPYQDTETDPKEIAFTFLESPEMMIFVICLVVIDLAIAGMMEFTTDEQLALPRTELTIFGLVCSAFFFVELTVRMWLYTHVRGPIGTFFKDPLSATDFLVVFLDLVTVVFMYGIGASAIRKYGAFIKGLRLARLSRLARIVKAIVKLSNQETQYPVNVQIENSVQTARAFDDFGSLTKKQYATTVVFCISRARKSPNDLFDVEPEKEVKGKLVGRAVMTRHLVNNYIKGQITLAEFGDCMGMNMRDLKRTLFYQIPTNERKDHQYLVEYKKKQKSVPPEQLYQTGEIDILQYTDRKFPDRKEKRIRSLRTYPLPESKTQCIICGEADVANIKCLECESRACSECVKSVFTADLSSGTFVLLHHMYCLKNGQPVDRATIMSRYERGAALLRELEKEKGKKGGKQAGEDEAAAAAARAAAEELARAAAEIEAAEADDVAHKEREAAARAEEKKGRGGRRGNLGRGGSSGKGRSGRVAP